MLLNKDLVHDSWNGFLTQSILREIADIDGMIGTDYTPPADKVLRFMSLNLDKIKVIILGQDPYKPEGVANGRAFQPLNLTSWSQSFRQVSLKNIIRNIYASYNDIEEYSKIPYYQDIVTKIVLGEFPIKQPYNWFDSLEEQGVLLLNTSLTCKIGVSNSHKGIWYDFSHELINYIAKQRTDLAWFMWGKEAAIYKQYIPSGEIYVSRHPMMCSEEYADDFLRNPCFKETRDIVNWLG